MAGLAVGQLVGDEETALAAELHAFKAGVPAWDDAVLAVGKADGLAAINGGVELGAVCEVAGVVDGVELAGLGGLAGADLGVDIEQREGGGLAGKGFLYLRAEQRRRVVELGGGCARQRIERLGACDDAGGKRWDLRRELRQLGAAGGGDAVWWTTGFGAVFGQTAEVLLPG